ncbi:MAG: DUF2218 domain-containing protein [Chloroflexota bacterium]
MSSETFTSEAKVNTLKAAGWIKTLCIHFQHKVTAEWSDNEGMVNFSKFEHGLCRMTAADGVLTLNAEAASPEKLKLTKGIVAGHLEKFAVKEGIKVDWQDS